ncbi:MAG: sulfatase-like hydrolase/transferase, partial [Bacteroidia bacterium]|nr:sulfatase-like hydrolase/transferase [Bacteroidia bacterium]
MITKYLKTVSAAALCCIPANMVAQDRPNILWLTTEDMSANHLSCYGNVDIQTPNIDAFASKGIRFTNAYSNAPQSSPARTTIITGMYSSTLMAEFHRKDRIYPSAFFYPILLRKAGYYCTNSGKTDYNSVYDVKGEKAVDIWNSNKVSSLSKLIVPEGKPFFAAINFYETHMSR